VNIPKDPKAAGELAELHFLLKASKLGFCVSKPYGDSKPYDFILEAGGRLQRVQVRSARKMKSGAYRVHAQRGSSVRRPFEEGEIDALVAYIIPEDAWYVFPIRAVRAMKEDLWLFPHVYRTRSRSESYREAWHLLKN